MPPADRLAAEAQAQHCGRCGRRQRFEFSVTDDVWAALVPEAWRDNVLCIECFAEVADEAQPEYNAGHDFMGFHDEPVFLGIVGDRLLWTWETSGEARRRTERPLLAARARLAVAEALLREYVETTHEPGCVYHQRDGECDCYASVRRDDAARAFLARPEAGA